MIIAIRTDSPITELELLDSDGKRQAQAKWTSGNRLSDELLPRLKKLLKEQQLSFQDITGLIVYKGPGSFTGLRIGITVANTLACANSVPIVGTSGLDWVEQGLKSLAEKKGFSQVLPEYGGEANITKPRK